ncbi:hypothetical protein P885DRAFT_30020 [Corynascus similis CBS 632.67]
MTHASRLPRGTTRAQALAMLSDHEFFLSCDPHLDKYDFIPPSDHASLTPPPSIPDHIQPQLRRTSSEDPTPPGSDEDSRRADASRTEEGEEAVPKCYRVTDVVHAIPAGIWDTSVVSTYEFTEIRDGLFVRIRSPMSVVMDTVWRVREVEEKGEEEGKDGARLLELVEEVTIRCSRLLVGIVKGQCENGWGGIHAKMIARLEGELKK